MSRRRRSFVIGTKMNTTSFRLGTEPDRRLRTEVVKVQSTADLQVDEGSMDVR